jgi:hypothetical protein
MSEIDYREKLRQAREKKGWTIDEAATQAAAVLTEINSWADYYDIEQHDGDLTRCYSLNEVSSICKFLDIHPRDLFCAENTPPVAIESVIEKIKDHCAQNGISIEQFEDKAGWEVHACLSNRRAALEEWNLDCLKAVCRELEMDWHGVVASL